LALGSRTSKNPENNYRFAIGHEQRRVNLNFYGTRRWKLPRNICGTWILRVWLTAFLFTASVGFLMVGSRQNESLLRGKKCFELLKKVISAWSSETNRRSYLMV